LQSEDKTFGIATLCIGGGQGLATIIGEAGLVMRYQIRKAAVLGAGVMGAGIAAHLANVGIPCILLDIVAPGAGRDRDKVARVGLEKALKARPAAFYSKRAASLVRVGNIEDDLEDLADVDWIIEAVVERLDNQARPLH